MFDIVDIKKNQMKLIQYELTCFIAAYIEENQFKKKRWR